MNLVDQKIITTNEQQNNLHQLNSPSNNGEIKNNDQTNNSSQKKITNHPKISFDSILCVQDLIGHMASFLPFYRFLRFRTVCKQFLNATDLYWGKFLIQKKMHFKCSFLEGTEAQQEKNQYILANTLCVYTERRDTFLECSWALKQGNTEELYNLFKERMSLYPILGAYIWKDLTFMTQHQSHLSLVSISKEEEEKFAEKEAFFLKSTSTDHLGGDSLLKGLYNLIALNFRNVPKLPDRFEKILLQNECLFQDAIHHQAPYASHLAIRMADSNLALIYLNTSSPFFVIPRLFYERLVKSSNEVQDYRGLESLLNLPIKGQAESFYEKGLYYPPILKKLAENAKQKQDMVEEENYYNLLIKYSPENYHLCDPELFLNIADCKALLGKNEEAEKYYELILFNFFENCTPSTFANIGFVKARLGFSKKLDKWPEAEKYYELSIEGYVNQFNNQIGLSQTFKFNLHAWSETKKYLENSFLNHSKNEFQQPHYQQLFLRLASTKVALGKWKEAETYYDFILSNIPINSLDPNSYLLIAFVQFKLANWSLMELYYWKTQDGLKIAPFHAPFTTKMMNAIQSKLQELNRL